MQFGKKTLVVFVAFLFLSCTVSAQAAPTRAERSLLVSINNVRAAHGVPPLRIDRKLERAARAHSRDMVRRGYFEHGNFAARVARFGARGPLLGENIAWGTGRRGTAAGVVEAWLASPPHRANLLRPGFRPIGIGRIVGRFNGLGGARVITADFAGR